MPKKAVGTFPLKHEQLITELEPGGPDRHHYVPSFNVVHVVEGGHVTLRKEH